MLIGSKWKIESDALNITLSRRHTVKATPKMPAHEIWVPEGYYSSVENALKGLLNMEVKATGFKDLETVLKRISQVESMIDKGIKKGEK